VTYIGLLRGVNLAGHNKIAMADLRGLLTRLGFADPRSLLQSGNVVFGSQGRSAARLERLLETEIEKQLKIRTDFYVRNPAEWRAIVAGNPFPDEAVRDPGHLVLLALKESPDAKRVRALQAAIVDREIVRVTGRHAYIVYPDGMGRSRLTPAILDRTIGRGTARNWNTVLKIAALAEDGK
jgi:uncharacterized protein (DUF1697 family)